MQRALEQDLSAKAVVIRELLRRSGLTAGQGRMRRVLAAFSAGGGPAGGEAGGEAAASGPPLRGPELERALERALAEVAELRAGAAGEAGAGAPRSAALAPPRPHSAGAC